MRPEETAIPAIIISSALFTAIHVRESDEWLLIILCAGYGVAMAIVSPGLR